MDKAMNLTYGDLILIEIALTQYLSNLDLSMQAGQYISELLGKVEYNLAELRQVTEANINRDITPANAGYDPNARK